MRVRVREQAYAWFLSFLQSECFTVFAGAFFSNQSFFGGYRVRVYNALEFSLASCCCCCLRVLTFSAITFFALVIVVGINLLTTTFMPLDRKKAQQRCGQKVLYENLLNAWWLMDWWTVWRRRKCNWFGNTLTKHNIYLYIRNTFPPTKKVDTEKESSI